jgi:hypothetical protein
MTDIQLIVQTFVNVSLAVCCLILYREVMKLRKAEVFLYKDFIKRERTESIEKTKDSYSRLMEYLKLSEYIESEKVVILTKKEADKRRKDAKEKNAPSFSTGCTS